MKRRKVLLSLVGLGVSVVGSMIWSSRLDYTPGPILEREIGSRLEVVTPSQVTDLSKQCKTAIQKHGWILFVLDANLIADDRFRTYLETAPEPSGLFVEYDLGTLRLGLGLGPESEESNSEISIRLVRETERATVVIGVTRDETRVVANAIDKRAPWPGQYADQWRCDAVQTADDLRESTHGNTCQGCDSQLRYAVGREVSELDSLLDDLSNVRRFNLLRILGTALTVLGVSLILVQLRARDHHPR